MSKSSDIQVHGTTLYFLPIRTRVPLKFGPETTTEVTCARVCVRVSDRQGKVAEGWGETPLSVQWVWPSSLPYQYRHDRLTELCCSLAERWAGFEGRGHPMELGYDFKEQVLPGLLEQANASRPPGTEAMPWLGALVCCSAFDIAVHDAFGHFHAAGDGAAGLEKGVD